MQTRLACAVLLLLLTARANADRPRAPLTRLASDMVAVEGGPQLYGSVLRHDEAGAAIVVERAWLKETYPPYYEQQAKAEREGVRGAGEKLLRRIRAWKERRAGEEDLVFFLDTELQRIEKTLAAGPDAEGEAESPFLLIEIDADRVSRVFRQPPQRRQIALLSWREGLANVTTRTAAALRRELEEKEVEDFNSPVDLSDQLPAAHDDDRQWAARMAIVEHQLRGKRLEFQGSGGLLVRTDSGGKEPDTASLIAGLFTQQLGGGLADLLGGGGADRGKQDEKKRLEAIAKAAEADGFIAAKVARVDQDLVRKTSLVEISLAARMPDGSWIPVLAVVENSDVSKVSPDALKFIEEDPRIAKALQAVQALGLGAAEEQVQQALRFGAATMQAQNAAEFHFHKRAQSYARRLDRPPVYLPAGEKK